MEVDNSGSGPRGLSPSSQSTNNRQEPGSVSSHDTSTTSPTSHAANSSHSGNNSITGAHASSSTQPVDSTLAVLPPQQVVSTQDLAAGTVYSPSRVEMRADAIPDLLHSHVIPTSSPSVQLQPDQGSVFHNSPPPSDPRGHHYPPSHRHHRQHYRDRHRPRRSRRARRSRSSSNSDDELCKHSCAKCMAATTSFRWILVILSLLGVCCVVTGIVLAALHATGQSFLFLAIMFIGLGVLLVVVVAVGWRCTPRGHEPLHALFGIGDFQQPQERRSRSRHHGRRSRDSHWYGGVMYPEFQYRRPPPSYNASMQDFQHQLVLAQTQRERFHSTEELPAEDYSLPSSPPPSYRSRASTIRTGIQITFPPMQGDNSHPPTYRSHTSTVGQSNHSRPSLPREGFSIQQNSSASNTRVHSRNNSASNLRVHSRSNSGVVMGASHSRNNSTSPIIVPPVEGAVVVTTNQVMNTSQDELLVQETLQSLDDAMSSGGQDNLAQDTQEENDDEYPMETQL